MSIFKYTATRELAPGTSASELVTRDFRLIRKRKSRKPVGKKNTSLNGAVEAIRFRAEQAFSCQTQLIEPGSLEELQIEEFLASVENAELFVFDRFGTVAVPANPVSCMLISNSYTASEQGFKFNRYGFVIREA